MDKTAQMNAVSAKKSGFFKRTWTDIRGAITAFGDDHATTYSAALAYYTVFAAAPLLLIAISVGAFFFGQEASSGEIYSAIQRLIGPEGAHALEAMVEAAAVNKRGIFATIVGIVTLIIGATTVFGQLQESLNQIWKVKPKPGAGIRTLLRQRLLSFSMVLVIALLLLVSLVASAVLTGLQKFATNTLPGGEMLWEMVNLGISFLMTSVLFGAIYKILPDIKLDWKDVRLGGVITAFFFTIGKFLIGLYLGQSAVTSAYGAAGAAVIILIWTYYTSAILLFGAEYARIRTLDRKPALEPKNGAEWIQVPDFGEKPGLATRFPEKTGRQNNALRSK